MKPGRGRDRGDRKTIGLEKTGKQTCGFVQLKVMVNKGQIAHLRVQR
jgi:hypothetical protein